MNGGKFRAGIALAVALLVIGLSRMHRIRNVVNGLRGARAARARRRRALRTRGAGIPGPRRAAASGRKVVQAA
ncbi:hypothetical protein [Nocardia barduliensis]|uniref:hypothetical protein n=1 Tax=Nocardia barduliensis TaxID=2736643 RepID=UPI0015735B6E|nr:hypothetical protein [Nocardia barduliensis]